MGKNRRKKHLPPFFDQVDNPELHRFPAGIAVDITPPPPKLGEFDRAVLHACGNLDSRVHREDFKELMRTYPEVFDRIKDAVDGEIFKGRNTEIEFLEDLTDIWFKKDGFRHIFCGVIEGENLKGLHYFGRYLDLQEKGLAGRLPYNLKEEEVIPGVVYTVGVLLKYGHHTIIDRRSGYALITDAIELLIAGTQAFKSTPRHQKVSIFEVVDREENISYYAVFVKENNAIVTFFPDATPSPPWSAEQIPTTQT